MKNLFSISLTAIILFSTCEKVGVVDSDISYRKYIVVRAELKAYSPFEGVSFTKTLPLDETYDISKAELKDVAAYLKINGDTITNFYIICFG